MIAVEKLLKKQFKQTTGCLLILDLLKCKFFYLKNFTN